MKNFLLRTLDLQLLVKGIDRFALEEGLMSASFKFLHSFKVLHNPVRGVDPLIADFGETAIRRLIPGFGGSSSYTPTQGQLGTILYLIDWNARME